MNQDPAVLALIGNTPIVKVTRLDTGPCELFLKLESHNPGGSIKDRVGLAMIGAAERDGRLQPGGVVVEATAGNTGIGLALVARAKGYRVVLVVPDKMSTEKVQHLRALGAEVLLTRSDVEKGHPEYYQDYAARVASQIPGAVFIDQFNNPANPLAHETTTGPEIWEQLDHRVDAVVVGVGSGGTLGGLSRYFATVSSDVEFVLADPQGSILADFVRTGEYGQAGSWAVEGIGEDFVPANADFSLVRHAYSIPDEESFAAARSLVRAEGILAGSSTGTLLAAALRYCRSQTSPKRVVTLVCDTGTRYLSKVYNESWLIDEGLLARGTHGDLRDLISRPFEEGRVVSVSPQDTLLTTFQRMRANEVQQVPVLVGDELAGIIDESDLLAHVAGAGTLGDAVEAAMTTHPHTLKPSDPLDSVRDVLADGRVALVADQTGFHGVITRYDLINHARKAAR